MEYPSLPGSPLTDQDYQGLEKCFISRETADAAFLRRVNDPEGRFLVGANGRRGDFAGIVFPYFDPFSKQVRAYRLRRDCPDAEYRDGKTVEKGKYMSAPGQGNLVYSIHWAEPVWLNDTTMPIVLCEGEKKNPSLWQVAWVALGDAAERPEFLPIGLSGVWSWRGRIGKDRGPDGRPRDVYGVIADLRSVNWQGRETTILFDANIHTNLQVREARRHVAGWLTEQGAEVELADLPREEGINGPDDAAAKHGPQFVLEILANEVP